MTLRPDLRTAARHRIELDDDHAPLTSHFPYDPVRQVLTGTLAELTPFVVRGAFDPSENVAFHAWPLEGGVWELSAPVEDGPLWRDGRATFNRHLPFRPACLHFGGLEDTDKSEFVLDASNAIAAARAMGVELPLPDFAHGRGITLRRHVGGQLVTKFERKKEDGKTLAGWFNNKFSWVTSSVQRVPADNGLERSFDDLLRQLVGPNGENAGWKLKSDSVGWRGAWKSDLCSVLISLGYTRHEADVILGTAINFPWTLVNLPFQDEYPGDRQWNYKAAQFAAEPREGDHPHWDMIMRHCGRELDAYISTLDWCAEDGLTTGADYLKFWLAFMLRKPFAPLPYLFFFGPENTGKSIFHEAARLLMTSGVVIADRALTSQSDFNGELANAVLCVVEEKDISKAPGAMSKIKEWVTGRNISIRKMHCDSFDMRNTTHWVQCANSIRNCPVIPGDTRITMIRVDHPERDIPKPQLLEYLEAQAPAFLFTLLNCNLPEPRGRLGLPVINTAHKLNAASVNEEFSDPVGAFMRECIVAAMGKFLPVSDAHAAYLSQLPEDRRDEWRSSNKFGIALKNAGAACVKHGTSRTSHIVNAALV